MARVTPIRTAEQTEYRLRGACASDTARQADAPVEYRLQEHGPAPIERIGSGWEVFGRTPGVPLGIDELDEVRAVMLGRDPRTGRRLAVRKQRVADDAKLPAAPLVAAIEERGQAPDPESWPGRRLARLRRGLAKDTGHAAPVKDVQRVARAAGLAPETVWPQADLDRARAHAGDREQAGARGWDLTFDAPKSVSVLWALSDPATARRIEQEYTAAVRETVATVEHWVARGQRGQQGRGRLADRIDTEGITGTLTLHTTARPVAGQADPHLHAHVMISALARGSDGQWGVIGAGGRELYQAVPAAGELLRANLRNRLTQSLGVGWEQDPQSQRWEVRGIPTEVRDLYSRRRDQAVRTAGADATPAQRRLAARRGAAAKLHGVSDTSQREQWAARARAAGHDPETLTAAARGQHAPEPADVHQLTARTAAAAWTERPTGGVRYSHLIATAARQHATGTDALLAEEAARRVAEDAQPTGAAGGAHLRTAARYTAPELTERDARAGRGPAARAAAPEVEAHETASLAARDRAAELRRQANALLHSTRRCPVPEPRRRDRARHDELTQAAAAADREAHRHADIALDRQDAAIDTDLGIARAQEHLRKERDARAAVALARMDQPPPSAALKGRPQPPGRPGPGSGIDPHYRPPPPPPRPGRNGPSL